MSKPRILPVKKAPGSPKAASKPPEAPKPVETPPVAKKKLPMPPRLPVGAVFHVVYGNEVWSGTLTIGEQTFAHFSRGVFGLLGKLDRMYRRSLKPTEAP